MTATLTHATSTDAVVAVVSMLHEPADRHSATRRFRNRPVLDWTLRRLSAATGVTAAVVLCWDDQADAARAVPMIADREVAVVVPKGPRQTLPTLAAIAAARRWSDGWRAGLLGTCAFDLGFHAAWTDAVAADHDADAVLLVDPAAGLIDPVLIDGLVDHAAAEPTAELCFMPAAPGLAATLVRRTLLRSLAAADVHPGRLLTYHPDQPGVDPLGRHGCAPTPTAVARSTGRFTLDTDRQIARADRALQSLNGHLVTTEAEELTVHMRGGDAADALPRDVVLELNTARDTRPAYWPGRSLAIDRPNLPLEAAAALVRDLGRLDDVRLTLAGVGDPLLCPDWPAVVSMAKAAGVAAVGVETDLVSVTPARIVELVDAGVDVVSVHFPAATAQTYAAVMGVDAFATVLRNVGLLEAEAHKAGRGVPLICPVFTKLAANLSEMELWYDYWVRRVGHAVIAGPTDYGGQVADVGVADMTPPRRRPCGRLSSRLTVLSDGTIVTCEQDVLARQPMGVVGRDRIADVWQSRFSNARGCHARGELSALPLCRGCREWHRP